MQRSRTADEEKSREGGRSSNHHTRLVNDERSLTAESRVSHARRCQQPAQQKIPQTMAGGKPKTSPAEKTRRQETAQTAKSFTARSSSQARQTEKLRSYYRISYRSVGDHHRGVFGIGREALQQRGCHGQEVGLNTNRAKNHTNDTNCFAKTNGKLLKKAATVACYTQKQRVDTQPGATPGPKAEGTDPPNPRSAGQQTKDEMKQLMLCGFAHGKDRNRQGPGPRQTGAGLSAAVRVVRVDTRNGNQPNRLKDRHTEHRAQSSRCSRWPS